MRAVRIHDMEPGGRFLAVDLRDVLDCLGERALESSWQIDGLWTIPESEANPLERLANRQEPVPGRALKEAANNVGQVIDGEFVAFDPGQDKPWVIVEAVDSSYYTVRSREPPVLSSIRDRFHDVSDYDHPES
jgi:hypothetical protein